METEVTKKKSPIKTIVTVIFGLLIGVAIYAMVTGANDSPTPKSAEGMSVEERNDNDSAVLLEELSGIDIVESVSVKYNRDAIEVSITKEKTDQYAEDDALEVIEAVRTSLADARGDLTLEKDSYTIYVKDKNGKVIKAEES